MSIQPNYTKRARQTEYNGVVFRSKTEAQFARLLDLVGCPWFYECDQLPEPPDFLVTVATASRPTAIAIELKPAQPTETYVTQANHRRLREWERHCGIFGPSLVIYAGNFYEDARVMIEVGDNGSTTTYDHWILPGALGAWKVTDGQIEKCRDYRFDLVEG